MGEGGGGGGWWVGWWEGAGRAVDICGHLISMEEDPDASTGLSCLHHVPASPTLYTISPGEALEKQEEQTLEEGSSYEAPQKTLESPFLGSPQIPLSFATDDT